MTRVRLPETPVPDAERGSMKLDGKVEELVGLLVSRNDAAAVLEQAQSLLARCPLSVGSPSPSFAMNVSKTFSSSPSSIGFLDICVMILFTGPEGILRSLQMSRSTGLRLTGSASTCSLPLIHTRRTESPHSSMSIAHRRSFLLTRLFESKLPVNKLFLWSVSTTVWKPLM